jgi:hypothetical protein
VTLAPSWATGERRAPAPEPSAESRITIWPDDESASGSRFSVPRCQMFEVILCGVAVAALIIQAADFWLRWFRKPRSRGEG